MEDERDLAFPLPLELTSELVTDVSEFLEELLPLESDDKVIGLSIEGMSLIRTSSSVLLNRLTMLRAFFDSGTLNVSRFSGFVRDGGVGDELAQPKPGKAIITLDNMEVLDTELSVISSLIRSSSVFNILVLLTVFTGFLGLEDGPLFLLTGSLISMGLGD